MDGSLDARMDIWKDGWADVWVRWKDECTRSQCWFLLPSQICGKGRFQMPTGLPVLVRNSLVHMGGGVWCSEFKSQQLDHLLAKQVPPRRNLGVSSDPTDSTLSESHGRRKHRQGQRNGLCLHSATNGSSLTLWTSVSNSLMFSVSTVLWVQPSLRTA